MASPPVSFSSKMAILRGSGVQIHTPRKETPPQKGQQGGEVARICHHEETPSHEANNKERNTKPRSIFRGEWGL